MEKIEPGKYVELGYDLYRINADGSETLMHQTDVEDPEKIVFGVTRGVIRPLEAALEGLTEGGKYNVKATADEAFGQRDPEQIATLDKNIFMVDGEFDSERIKAGAVLPMMTADGYRIDGLVEKVTDKHVVMDFNHPLAGYAVRIDGKVLKVRDATPEELKPRQCGGCGCGDEGCDCGDGGCDCGDKQGSCGCGCN